MVGFLIPIPSKVVDNVYNSGSNLVKSYKKEPLPTDLGPNQDGEKSAPPPPAPRRSVSNSWASRSTAPPPPRAGGGAGPPARALAHARVGSGVGAAAAPAGSPNMETFGPQLLAHVLDSISLLQSIGQISPEAARNAAAALDGSAGGAHDAGYAVPAPPTRVAARAPPAAPPAPAEKRATALWDYGQGGDANDLEFQEGDTVVIDEEINGDWWRGRTIPKGHSEPLPKSGMFPSNYVQPQ